MRVTGSEKTRSKNKTMTRGLLQTRERAFNIGLMLDSEEKLKKPDRQKNKAAQCIRREAEARDGLPD